MFEALWAELDAEPLSHGLVQRRVRPDLPHDVFLVHSRPARQRHLALRLKGPVGEVWRRVHRSRGIDFNIVLENTQSSFLRINEAPHSQGEQRDLFEALVTDLVTILTADPGVSHLDRVCSRLIAWQSFFELAIEGLSAEAEAGLFGELHILTGLLIPAVGPNEAVESWKGPEPALQDFQRRRIALETKSSRATGPIELSISSERQLDMAGIDRLFLVVIRLDARTDGTGSTLAEAVNALRQILSTDPRAHRIFDSSLLSVGFMDAHAPRYTTRFTVRDIDWYEVQEGFPRIVESMVPDGIGSVRYNLSTSACEPWRVDEAVFTAAFESERS